MDYVPLKKPCKQNKKEFLKDWGNKNARSI